MEGGMPVQENQLLSCFGGQDGKNLDMAIVREHFTRKGLGLHNDL